MWINLEDYWNNKKDESDNTKYKDEKDNQPMSFLRFFLTHDYRTIY